MDVKILGYCKMLVVLIWVMVLLVVLLGLCWGVHVYLVYIFFWLTNIYYYYVQNFKYKFIVKKYL